MKVFSAPSIDVTLMVIIRSYIWILLLNYGRRVMCAVGDSGTCLKREFVEYADLGFVSQDSTYRKPATMYDCKRLCRLYVECQAFAMEWLDSSKDKGNCLIINRKLQPEDVKRNTSSSLFEPPRDATVKCNASSTGRNTTECDNALVNDKKSWWSAGRGTGEWLNLTYSEAIFVSEVVLRSKPNGLQCKIWNVTYSYDTRQDSIITPCSNKLERFSVETTLTEYVLLTCSEKCSEEKPNQKRTMLYFVMAH